MVSLFLFFHESEREKEKAFGCMGKKDRKDGPDDRKRIIVLRVSLRAEFSLLIGSVHSQL